MNPAIVMVIWAASGSFHDRPMVLGNFHDMAQCEAARTIIQRKHADERPALIVRCVEMSPL